MRGCCAAASAVGDRGFFLAPTVISGLQQDDEIVQQEVFGPVITVQRADGEADAIAMANGVEYGCRRACGRATTRRRCA
jgi:betaine-aldehyde dehydrogenase